MSTTNTVTHPATEQQARANRDQIVYNAAYALGQIEAHVQVALGRCARPEEYAQTLREIGDIARQTNRGGRS